ncbi:flavin-binding family monooxygenase [gamma proteobacterium HdN1]|nr:flavin-binding family monooxygenase [gamma proteobacterium HdN1]
MNTENFDVIIIGAGLSGIGAARHLQKHCPEKRYVVLESRDAIGGTWDLFRYPGVRSDSDMFTLGYEFKPWTGEKSIADGGDIRQYIRDTAAEYGIDRKIRFGQKIISAEWDTDTATWTLEAEVAKTGQTAKYRCNFLLSCTGYYNYQAGFTPEFPGRERFQGQVIHPQHWPQDLDYAGKRVVIIGSGATAVTLAPAMTDKAASVTMLQRSPTYILTVPERDPIAPQLRKFLPETAVYHLTRARNVALNSALYQVSKGRPKAVRRLLLAAVRQQVGPDVDMKHFTPRYNPWEERLCAVPNGDMFKAIREGRMEVVTDHIETFTENGIRLKSGNELPADIIVTATGLDLLLMGGITVKKDGQPIDLTQKMAYKGALLQDVPNLAMVFGYTNSSWTLKADLVAEYVCRLIKYMDKAGVRQVVAHNTDPTITTLPFLNFAAGYVQRALKKFPIQGNKAPWEVRQNYFYDLRMLRFGAIKEQALQFSNPVGRIGARKKVA